MSSSTFSASFTPSSPENKLFLNKRVLVTGGTSGIGKSIAYAFANEGAKVVITGRRQEKGIEIAREIGGHYLPVDHSKIDENHRVIQDTVTFLGGLDILINNVGIVLMGNIETTTDQEWMEIFNVNVHAAYIITKNAVPYLRKAFQLTPTSSTTSSTPSSHRNHSIIINIASDWGIVGARNYLAYCTTKGALVQMTKCLALDYIDDGIRVNCVCPGDTYVERWSEEGYYRGSTEKVTHEEANKDAAIDQSTGYGIPIGRVAITDEITDGVLFLASYKSSYMVGQTLIIDGGNTCK